MFPTYSQSIGLNGTNATLDLFNQTLGNNNVLRLASVGRLGFSTCWVDVQLRDTAQRPLMTIMMAPGQSIPYGRLRITVLQMVDTSGQILLMARSVAGSVTISSGEHILGIIQLRSTSITVKDHMGNVLLLSVAESSSVGCLCSILSAFTLQSNGVILARVEQPTDNSDGCIVSLLDSSNTEVRTKALVIFSGYFLYYTFLSETQCGRIGARALTRRFRCFIYFVFMLFVISIIISVLRTSQSIKK